jgi:hypothetical protein
LLTGTPAASTEPEAPVRALPSDLERRVQALEELVHRLAGDLSALRAELGVSGE